MRTGWSVTTQLLSLAVQWHKEHQHWQYFSVGAVVSMVSSFVSIVSTCHFDVHGWMHIGLGFRVTKERPSLSPFICWMWMFLPFVLSPKNNPLVGVFLEWFFSVL